MKILIIGNITSGKTTLGKKLEEMLEYEFVRIDSIREEHLDGTVSGEYLCLHNFIKKMEQKNNAMFEFTGAGCHKHAIKRVLEQYPGKKLIVLCRTSNIQIIEARIEKKTYSYEHPFGIDIRQHIYKVEEELKDDIKNEFWKMNNSVILGVHMNCIENIEQNAISIYDRIGKES